MCILFCLGLFGDGGVGGGVGFLFFGYCGYDVL